jgi:hypothetical protein
MTKRRRGLVIAGAIAVAIGGAILGGVKGLPTAANTCSATNSHGEQPASVVYNNQVHIFDYNTNCDTLVHQWWDGSSWHTETLDGASSGYPGHTSDNVGNYNVAIVYNGQLQDFYYDYTTHSLRHAWWNGSAWSFETLDGPGTAYASGGATNTDTVADDRNSAVIYNGQLQLFYNDYDSSDHRLRHAWYSGGTWHFENLDGPNVPKAGTLGRVTYSVGYDTSSIVQSNGTLHVFYGQSYDTDLRHGWYNGSYWQFEYLDGPDAGTGNGQTDDDVGGGSSVVNYNGQVNVFYDCGSGWLRHAWYNGSSWGFETIDGDGNNGVSSGSSTDDVGNYTGSLVWGNTIQVIDTDESTYNDSLRHSWYKNGHWYSETLDGQGSGYAGHSSDTIGDDDESGPLALIYGNQLQFYYSDYNNSRAWLREAWYTTYWSFATI